MAFYIYKYTTWWDECFILNWDVINISGFNCQCNFIHVYKVWDLQSAWVASDCRFRNNSFVWLNIIITTTNQYIYISLIGWLTDWFIKVQPKLLKFHPIESIWKWFYLISPWDVWSLYLEIGIKQSILVMTLPYPELSIVKIASFIFTLVNNLFYLYHVHV